jgi:hypothetical protein
VITYHSREIRIILLLLLSCYYPMEYTWIIIGDRVERVWMDLDLVGQQSGALFACVLPVSIKDCSLHWIS